MKPTPILFLLILLVIAILSCNHNRLKTNEKELAKEIVVQEKEMWKVDSSQQGNGPERQKLSGSFRMKEIRSVDQSRPPVRINILDTLRNTRRIKLSDVGSSIRYVKLQTPPDTSLLYDHFYYRPDLDSKIRSDGQQIIFQGLFGLSRFNMNGEYQETIWKNKTGIRFFGKSYVAWGRKDFFGVPFNIPVSLSEGNLYFAFWDGSSGTDQVMKYKSGNNKALTSQPQTEIPGPGIIPGETLLVTNHNNLDRFEWIYGISDDTWAGLNNKWVAGTSGVLMVTYNDKGDTLCKFKDYEPIVNYSFGDWRIAVELKSYYYNGLLTLKQEYNDTIFRLLPPDRLLPVYIMDFGKYKVNCMDGLNPKFDLSGKLMLNSLLETNNFLFIRYTKNHDGPANRRKNAVKFYNALFDKRTGKILHQPEITTLPYGLENDLDGGMPFWPEFITPQGEMMKLVSGSVIKDYVYSGSFKKADISDKDRQKQIIMASGLKSTDMIVIIVK
jgi:hypothetical protein